MSEIICKQPFYIPSYKCFCTSSELDQNIFFTAHRLVKAELNSVHVLQCFPLLPLWNMHTATKHHAPHQRSPCSPLSFAIHLAEGSKPRLREKRNHCVDTIGNNNSTSAELFTTSLHLPSIHNIPPSLLHT